MKRAHWPAGLILAVGLALPLPCVAKAKRDGRGRELSPPEFTPAGGVFTNAALMVTLAARPGAVIRFTLDGSEPNATSAVYSAGLTLTNCALVRAKAFAPQTPPSETVSQTYTLLDPGLTDFSSSLPLVILNTFGEAIGLETKIAVAARFIEIRDGRSSIQGPANFDGRALLNFRGRASLRYPKRSFNLRTVDEQDDPVKVPLLGFPKDWDWVLYAPYPDKTLMRDMLAYELSNRMGRYAPRTRFIELFVQENGARLREQDYLGVYVLEEKVAQGKQRVDIQKLGPDDVAEPRVTGGYIFKKDHSDAGELVTPNLGGFPPFTSSSGNRNGFPTGPGGFPADPAGFLPAYEGGSSSREVVSSRSRASSRSVTNRLGAPPPRVSVWRERRPTTDEDDDLPANMEGFRTALATNHLYFVEPEPDELNAVQRTWLINHLNRFEAALYGPNFRDPATGYAAFIDPDSFLDHHLIVEVTKNVDGFRFSTFFHKDRGGRIKMGPIWDWNLSFGNANGKQGWMPEHWLWPQLDDREYSWFRRLFEDADFGQRYVDRWAELRRTILATSNVLVRIDELATFLHEAQARNFQRWPILGRNVHPQWYFGDTYADEVNWMKDWIRKRLDWIERQFVTAPVLSGSENGLAAGRSLNLTAKAGKIYFTLDGTDPRAPGGAISAKASEYRSPEQIKPEARVFARARQDNRWSSPTVARLATESGTGLSPLPP
jgi:hypothetical protein